MPKIRCEMPKLSCDVDKACAIDQKCAVCCETNRCDVPKQCQEFWDFNITPALLEPRIMLRVGLMPPVAPDSNGVLCHAASLNKGTELGIVQMELVPPSDPLLWRHIRKKAPASPSEASSPRQLEAKPWWSTSNQAVAQPAKARPPSVVTSPPPHCGLAAPVLYYRARVAVMDEEGNVTEHNCLLQTASSSCERTISEALSVLDRSAAVAIYAAKFNAEVAANSLCETESQKSDDAYDEQELHDSPSLMIAIPVGCTVISSLSPEILGIGQSVVLFPYSAPEVQKFVYTEPPTDNACELPQAFFHFMAYLSGGRQLVWDLQGCEYGDGSILLVDPFLLQRPYMTQDVSEFFHRLHPACSALCVAFTERLRTEHIRTDCRPGNSHCLAGSQCMTEGLVSWVRCAEAWARHNVPAAMRCRPDADYDEAPNVAATIMSHQSMVSETSAAEFDCDDFEMSPRIAHEALIVGKRKSLTRFTTTA